MAQRSLYELLNGSETVVARQRFVYEFLGGYLQTPNWTFHNIAGTGSQIMTHDGLKLLTGTGASNNVQIDFNNKRQYDYKSSRTIGCIKRVSVDNCFIDGGFKAGYGDDNSNLAFLHIEEYSSIDGIFFQTNAAKSDTSIPTDLQWHNYDIELTPASGILTVGGSISVTRTTDLPGANLQPAFKILTRISAAAEGRVKYCEAMNT